MVEQQYKDIVLYAKWQILFYADGYAAQIVSQKPGKDQNGNDVWDFILRPTPELIKRYEIKTNPDGTIVYKAQYPYDMVIQLNPDPSWGRWFYLGTYDGKSTPAIQTLGGFSQQKIIIELKKELNTEKKLKEAAEEKLYLMEINMPKYMKRNVTPFLDEFTPFIEKVVAKASDKDK